MCFCDLYRAPPFCIRHHRLLIKLTFTLNLVYLIKLWLNDQNSGSWREYKDVVLTLVGVALRVEEAGQGSNMVSVS